MQKKRNIRLLIILAVLVMVTVVTAFVIQPKDQLEVDRDLFSYESTFSIDQVVIDGSESIELMVDGNTWMVNQSFEADPQRINVLFAILKQVKIRRKVAERQEESINKLFQNQGVSIKLMSNGEVLKSFKVVGDESASLTYMRLGQEEMYLVEIPGYRSYLAGIFQLDQNGWRNPLVFDLNWANLASVKVSYPEKEENGFSISFDNRKLKLNEGTFSDSLKLGNYIDDVSLLYVNDYLNHEETASYKNQENRATIIVNDIASNDHVLQIYDEVNDDEYLVRIDSSHYGLIDKQLVRRVTKPRSYFQ